MRGCKVDSSGTIDKKKTVFAILPKDGELMMLQAATEVDLQLWVAAIIEVPGAKLEKVRFNMIVCDCSLMSLLEQTES